MKKILVLSEAQFGAVKNAVYDAVNSVTSDYGSDAINNASDEDEFFHFSGTEMPSEHRALDSIDFVGQTNFYCHEDDARKFADLTLDEMRDFFGDARALYDAAENALQCKLAQFIQEWAKSHKDVTRFNGGVYKNDGQSIFYLGENTAGFDVTRMEYVIEALKSYKPQWTTVLDFPDHQETEDEYNNRKYLYDSFEEAMASAQGMAEQYAIDVMHASVTDGVTCHIHVRQYATPESDPANVIEVYNDEDPEHPYYDYRVEVKRV